MEIDFEKVRSLGGYLLADNMKDAQFYLKMINHFTGMIEEYDRQARIRANNRESAHLMEFHGSRATEQPDTCDCDKRKVLEEAGFLFLVGPKQDSWYKMKDKDQPLNDPGSCEVTRCEFCHLPLPI